MGEAVPPQPTSGNPVEDEVLHGLSTRQAVSLVAGLSRDQAEVVALRIIAGLDTDTVARILRKSPGAVRTALHRGLRTLSDDPRIHEDREGRPVSTARGGESSAFEPGLEHLIGALTSRAANPHELACRDAARAAFHAASQRAGPASARAAPSRPVSPAA